VNFQGYCDVFLKCRAVDADGPPSQIDESPLEQGNIIKRRPVDNELLVGRPPDGHRIHHIHGPVHQVLRRPHSLF
jgi:hypothetical protein